MLPPPGHSLSAQEGSLEPLTDSWRLQGALLGCPTPPKEGESTMAVKVRINDREFLLSWEQFEKCFYKSTSCLEVLDVYEDKKVLNLLAG